MKTKSKLWLGVCTVALCLGLMAFGVYSVLSATLNLSGNLGFNMHNAIVEVSGTISPVAEKDSSNMYIPTTKEIKRAVMGGEQETISNINIGDLYFYSKEDMVFDFSFKNLGSLPIIMTITIDLKENADKISIVEDTEYLPFTNNTYENCILANDTKQVKFALKLNDTSIELGKNAFNIEIAFIETQAVTLTDGYYEGIKYTLHSTTPIASSSAKASYLSSSVTPLSTQGIFTASASGYNAEIPADAKIQSYVTDGTNLYMVTGIQDSAFADCTNITSVTIPDSVTSIGNSAFYCCRSLSSITIPDSVTSINGWAFAGCDGLTRVNISSLEAWCNVDFASAGDNPLYYGNNLYLNDVKITDLEIPSSIKEIKPCAFCNCTSLTSITIPNSVTSIGSSAFWYCSGLTGTLNIPNSVTSIGNDAFKGCSNLQYNTDDENDPNEMLKYLGNESNNYLYLWGVTNTSLTTASINSKTKFIGSSVFSSCTSLTSVSIPNSVTSIGYQAFYMCTGLTSITIPNSVTSIGSYAFYKCTGITSITIPNSVTSIGNSAFYSCTGLTGTLNIPNSVTSIGNNAFYGCTKITSVTIPDSVTSIGDKTFYNCTGLTGTLNIPNNVTSIGSSAFYNCTGLTSVTIPNSVTSIGEKAFYGCSISQFYTDGALKYLGNENNKYIYLWGVTDTSLATATINSNTKFIGSSAFNGCTSLTSVTIPNSVTSIGDKAFYGCTSLTNVTIPDSVTSIGEYAFYGCSGLASITIPNSVTSIGSYAFAYCSGLTSVSIGNSVTSIGSYAFAYCRGLTSVTIPNSVTSIGPSAFSNCSGLTSVSIGNSVTSIGNQAFYGCTNLKTVINNSTHITVVQGDTGNGYVGYYADSVTNP